MEMGRSQANAPSPVYELTALSCQGFWAHGWLLAVTPGNGGGLGPTAWEQAGGNCSSAAKLRLLSSVGRRRGDSGSCALPALEADLPPARRPVSCEEPWGRARGAAPSPHRWPWISRSPRHRGMLSAMTVVAAAP